jgi:phospholipase/lecithinase/hemolysin
MSEPTQMVNIANLNELSKLELAQALMERLTISANDWHQLKSNRKVRASEQAAAALVFLLKDQPEEALQRLQQASGWLDRSISAPPCPTHGQQREQGELRKT